MTFIPHIVRNGATATVPASELYTPAHAKCDDLHYFAFINLPVHTSIPPMNGRETITHMNDPNPSSCQVTRNKSFSNAFACSTGFLRTTSFLLRPLRPGHSQIRPVQPSRHVFTAQLKKNRLGSSDLHVTEVCLGSMMWGSQNTLEQGHEQLDYAIKRRGVNFIDTAEMYPIPAGIPEHNSGYTEQIIGEWVAKNNDLRKELIIASKILGHQTNSRIAAFRYPVGSPERDKFPDSRLKRKDIRDACHASLKRLQTDYIDLYQIHWPDRYVPLFGPVAYDPSKERESTSIQETLMAIKELLDEGKIRAYGLSNETTYGVAEYVHAADALGMPRPVTIQNQYCLLNRRFEGELAEACSGSNYNIGLLPYSILGGGALTAKYVKKINAEGQVTDPSMKNTRMFLYNAFMGRYRTKIAQSVVEKYAVISKEAGVSMATLAQAFCKAQWFIPSSIIGATSMDQLNENISSFEYEISADVMEKINELHRENKDVALQG